MNIYSETRNNQIFEGINLICFKVMSDQILKMVWLPVTAGGPRRASCSCTHVRESMISRHLNTLLVLAMKKKEGGNDNALAYETYLCKGHQKLRQHYTGGHTGTYMLLSDP